MCFAENKTLNDKVLHVKSVTKTELETITSISIETENFLNLTTLHNVLLREIILH